MFKYLKSFFQKNPEPVAEVPQTTFAAQPIHINISNIGSIERNKARITRLERAIELGQDTPEIRAELEARKKSLAEIAELAK